MENYSTSTASSQNNTVAKGSLIPKLTYQPIQPETTGQ